MIESASEETEKNIEDLFQKYQELLELNQPFDPLTLMTGNETERDIVVRLACVESTDISHIVENPMHVQFNAQSRQINVQPRGVPTWHTEKSVQRNGE